MKDIINLAVVNFKTVWGDKSANLDKMVSFIKEGGEKSVDLMVFPETCLTGYVNDKEPVREKKMHARLAETLNGESVKVISELSKKFNMYVVFGASEKDENTNTVYNSAIITTPSGEVKSYRKIHLPFDEKEWATNGDTPLLLETEWGKIGITICYDTYCFPELIRYYRAKGARLLLNVTACPSAPCTFGAAKLTLPAYAYINYMYIATANLCGKEFDTEFAGGSCVVGIDETHGNSKVYLGKMFGEPNAREEKMYVGEIDLSLADKYTDIPIFRGDWRADLYKKLLSEF